MKNKGRNSLITAAAVLFAVFALKNGQILSTALQGAAALGGALCMPEASAAHITAALTEAPPPSHSISPPESQSPAPEPAISLPNPPLPEQKPAESAPTAAQNDGGSSAVEDTPPDIPQSERGRVLTEDMSGSEGNHILRFGSFLLRNDTTLSKSDIAEVLSLPTQLSLQNTTEPQVLIYHTHATESYCPFDNGIYDKRYNWRSTDNNNNMVAVGAVIAQQLTDRGIAVIHDTSQHDYPSYDGSYANSYRSIKDYLAHYPTIKVVLDVHRDAIERENGVIVKPTAVINGEKYAQLMIISNCDDGSGLIPNWRENLRFAAAFADKLEQNAQGITRPLLFSYRKYNQQLSGGALLLEFGSHANTLEESKRTARLVGQSLAELLSPPAERN